MPEESALLVAIDLCLVVRPGPFDDWKKEGIRNPLGIGRLEPVTSVLLQTAILLSFLLLLASLASVVIRFRRSTGIERLQLRWIVTAVAATGLTWVTMIAASVILGDRHAVDYFWGAAILSISLIPIGIGIAVMRYRLYEIDRLISRTLVYAALTIVLGASYVGLVLGGQALFSSFAGGSNLAIAASTLVVAALFLPVRSRVQGFVDRRFYRRRYDAQRTLEGFGARLREQIDLGTLEGDLQAVVAETMQPAHSAVWLRHRSPTVRALAWTLFGAIAVLAPTCAALGIAGDRHGLVLPEGRGPMLPQAIIIGFAALELAIVGLLIARRQPRNPIGWIFLASGALLALVGCAYGYADLSLYGGLDWPLTSVATWLTAWAFLPPVFFALVPDRAALPDREAADTTLELRGVVRRHDRGRRAAEWRVPRREARRLPGHREPGGDPGPPGHRLDDRLGRQGDPCANHLPPRTSARSSCGSAARRESSDCS